MPSDYEAITRHNERQLGLDTSSRKTQICMYSDSTHFIYEILQNADDYGATEIFFKLSKHELLIEHNGEPFTEENVKAITYIGKSTSRDDLVKTGHFGVGFKSVFAFTATPIIISGDEHFQIFGLYRVKEYPYPNSFSRLRTRMMLPFNHISERPDYVENLMSPEDAYSKISTRLTSLNMNSLLFTRNIREIRWEIDGRSGHYLREDNIDGVARRTTITDGEQLNKYLVFSKVPQWRNQEYKAVEIAFAVDDKHQLMPIDDFLCVLYVLFATTQETHLQFILNGPYRTNPSRETISEDDHFNVHLMKETCTLMKDMLPQIQGMGLLTTQFLSVLPNVKDKLRDFYTPLRDVIIETFRKHELVPTDDDRYAPAINVFQGPAQLREVISGKELPFFVGKDNVCWAKGVLPNSRADDFLQALGIQQWSWEQLQTVLDKKYGEYSYDEDEKDISWLAERGDSWLQKLYILLADAIKRNECSEETLKQCRIIRVLEGGRETYVAGSRAYFPNGRKYKELPQVKHAILCGKNEQITNKIQESLIALGISKIGDEEQIDLILENFYGEESPGITDQKHLQHMSTFIKWWKKEKNARKFKGYTIFWAEDDKLRKPDECYLDSPIHKSGLDIIYKDKNCNIPRKWKLWSGYRKLDGNDFCDFAISCGVDGGLTIEKLLCYIHTNHVHPNSSFLRQDYKGGVKFTSTGIDHDYTIKGLPKLLKMKSRDVNLLIWRTVSKADPEVLEACFRPNKQCETRTDKSSLVITLSKAEWIPDKRGHFHKPCEITKEQLHPDLKYDNRNGWLDAIGFGENAKKASEEYQMRKEMASSLGMPVEIPDLLSKLTKEEREKANNEYKEILRRMHEERKRTQRLHKQDIPYHEALGKEFSSETRGITLNHKDTGGHGGSAWDPSRRQAKISEEIAEAMENEGKLGARSFFSLRKKWKGKNDQVRIALSEWYRGQCQICDETFIKRSGEPYFEGLYLVPYTTKGWVDRVGNVLCLCPLHSAMFMFGHREVDEDVIQQVMRLKTQAEGGGNRPVIRMKLCGNRIEIAFAEKHLIDLQEMIRASQSSK